MSDPLERLPLPRPIAFAFSGGTSLGALQVGMLRALWERGVVPDLLVGSSVGAINAAFIGGGFDPDRIDALEAVWSRVTAWDIFGPPGIGRLLAVIGDRGALAPPAGLLAIIHRNLARRHADLAIPTAVVATDLLSGVAVILEDGDLRRHVLASAAIPGLFPPVVLDGRTLADGGLAAQVPVLQAIALGAASVVVLDVGYPCTLAAPPRGLIANVVHAASLVFRQQSTEALRRVGTRATVLYLPSPCPLDVAPWDFSRSATLVEKGHRYAARYLADLQTVGPGVHGNPHLHVSEDERPRPVPLRPVAAGEEPAHLH